MNKLLEFAKGNTPQVNKFFIIEMVSGTPIVTGRFLCPVSWNEFLCVASDREAAQKFLKSDLTAVTGVKGRIHFTDSPKSALQWIDTVLRISRKEQPCDN